MDLSKVSNLPVLHISLDGGRASVENHTSSTTIDIEAETAAEARKQALEECSETARQIGRPVKVQTHEAETGETFRLIVGPEPGEVCEDTTPAPSKGSGRATAKKTKQKAAKKPPKKQQKKKSSDTGNQPLLSQKTMIRMMAGLVVLLILTGGFAAAKHFIPSHQDQPKQAAPSQTDGPWTQDLTTGTTPMGSSDGKAVLISREGNHTVLSADTGQQLMSLGEDKDQTDAGQLNGGGFATLSNKQALIYKPGEADPQNISIPNGTKWAVRAGSMIELPSTKATTPDAVTVRTMNNTDGVRFKSPAKAASFAVPNREGTKAYWATAQDGGTLIEADAAGKITKTTKLSGPKDHTLDSWVGATPDGKAITYWKAKKGDKKTLVVHSPKTGAPLSTAPAGDHTGTSVTYTDNALATGGNIVSYNGRIISAPKGSSGFKATTGGFTAQNSAGHKTFITDQGKEIPGSSAYTITQSPHPISATNNRIERKAG